MLLRPGQGTPLFCIHGAGGHAALDYKDLAASLPDDQPVYGFSLPALEQLPTVEQLASIYLQEVRKIQQHGPYQLCGYSFGGLVAYEMACILVDERNHVSLLALFDTIHPASGRNPSIARQMEFGVAYLIDRFAKYGRNLLRGNVVQIAADVASSVSHRVPRLAWKVARFFSRKSTRPIPRVIRSNQLVPIPRVIRSNQLVLNEAGSRYNPRQYSGNVVLFRSLTRDVEYKMDVTLGWKLCVIGRLDVQFVQGDHFSIMFLPNVKLLVDLLAPYLSTGISDETSR
jgi:thioesterase domain-containing protein